MKGKILLLEDELRIAEAIAYGLEKEGLTVKILNTGQGALKAIEDFQPDVLLLDVMLPGMDGFEILKRLSYEKSFGVLMLTAKGEIIDKVLGLELGADDYMTKPFDMRELLARVKSLLRRVEDLKSQEKDTSYIEIRGVKVYPEEHRVYAGDTLLDLTPKEYELLATLFLHPDRVYEREQLLDLIWGMDYIGGTRTVDLHVGRLRKKLGPQYADVIETKHGVGYKVSGGSL
ncbi:response regulator transcription factor [Proteiniclasticum ruminis]|uniref:Stage 0 sporulation protein A homolog n=1 Tax=Proteiniclasticum ruminis TaxID=398199 RepID=A0A1G8LS81_9CLOT|nr:response regulator transcription factor [Proteiniclasticum ruminis]SDI58347.1 DNA-binding response regulator, OmpR family, contains REC and winged-helix (wHTH) domain [Proteiniclasticum ruminis]